MQGRAIQNFIDYYNRIKAKLDPKCVEFTNYLLAQNNIHAALNNVIDHISNDFEGIRLAGEAYLEDGGINSTISLFIKIDFKDGLKKAADVGSNGDFVFDAVRAYKLLNDRQGLKNCLRKLIEKDGPFVSEQLLSYFPGKDLEKVIYPGFHEFCKHLNINARSSFGLSYTINAGYNLARNYDLGIGIARGGLWSTYIFNLFDLETHVVDSHKIGKSASFKWISGDPDAVKGKKVIVFDKDICSGRTLRRVGRELAELHPESLDLFMNVPSTMLLHKVPDYFQHTFYPKCMTYESLCDAIDVLEEKLLVKNER